MVDFEFLFKISSLPFSAICDTKDGPREMVPKLKIFVSGSRNRRWEVRLGPSLGELVLT
jgi:hypothetical protein